ncbi:MAG: ABC transporter permease subunit [Candidatus Methanomethylicia archaeon]
MRSTLLIILRKEVKEMLRDPKILIGMILAPILILGVMSGIMNMVMSSAKESVSNPKVVVLDYDNTQLSNAIIDSLEYYSGGRIIILHDVSIGDAVNIALGNEFSTIMVFPKGFEHNVSIGMRSIVEIYSIMSTLSIAESGASSIPSSIIDFLKSEIVNDRIRALLPNVDPNIFLNPIEKTEYSIIKGRIIKIPPQIIFSIIMSQSIFIPMSIMIVFISAMQFASTSIALEKEYKTLETLLTLPVSRFTILLAKLIGSVILAILGSASFMVAYTYYYTSITSFGMPVPNISLGDIGLTITPLGFVLVGLTLFLSIVSSLVLAILIATFAEDVRSAQTLVGYLYFIIIVPMMVSMFTDISTLPMSIRIILYAIPYTYMLISPRAALLENYQFLVIGIIYMLIFSIIILYIASRFFRSEKVLTARISFKRKR